VGESVRQGLETRPFEDVAALLAASKAWAVNDCICRKQQALIGKACGHPLEVCMMFSDVPGAFDDVKDTRALTQEEALATLRRAAEAGLVHSATNSQKGVWYVCNCCTCGCAVLRGISELGLGSVIAPSGFVCQVDEEKCVACGLCVERCQFGALAVEVVAQVDSQRCVGCGVCTLACPDEALQLMPRPAAETTTPPETEEAWRLARAAARGIKLEAVR
jgi:Fe-S-cluster-containing hydrogenase component 2